MRRSGIHLEGISKQYGTGDTAVLALREVNMSVAPGEVVGLIGPSGSGKSTLLKCLGAVIDPTAGRMLLGDEVIYDNGWPARTRWNCSPRWMCSTGPTPCPPGCPAANSSAWPLPGDWSTNRR